MWGPSDEDCYKAGFRGPGLGDPGTASGSLLDSLWLALVGYFQSILGYVE